MQTTADIKRFHIDKKRHFLRWNNDSCELNLMKKKLAVKINFTPMLYYIPSAAKLLVLASVVLASSLPTASTSTTSVTRNAIRGNRWTRSDVIIAGLSALNNIEEKRNALVST